MLLSHRGEGNNLLAVSATHQSPIIQLKEVLGLKNCFVTTGNQIPTVSTSSDILTESHVTMYLIFSDVTPVVDAQCSGRQSCLLPITYFVSENIQPCPKDVTTYLEVSYTCQKGTVFEFHVPQRRDKKESYVAGCQKEIKR